MSKLKLFLSLGLFLTIFFVYLNWPHNVTKEEALEFTKPMITSILKYKKTTGKYPVLLEEIKDFPYEIYRHHPSRPYKFKDRKDFSIEANKYTPGINSYLKYVYYIQLDFFESRAPRAVTGMSVFFREDGSYKISYYYAPGAFKQ